jgi:hypothetical protein
MSINDAYKLFKKVVQQGRSERKGEAYFVSYVEPLSDARTTLATFFNSLIIDKSAGPTPATPAHRPAD